MSWIRVGVAGGEELPGDRLEEKELRELQAMCADREKLLAQAAFIEERIQLLLLVARDRRDLRGPVRCDPATGELRLGEVGNAK